MKEKPSDGVRLDKWLWAARFYKTRALAREMIDGGKVHYNGQRSKPSKLVELNATLTLRQGNDERTVVIKAITEQRGPQRKPYCFMKRRRKALKSARRPRWRAK
jgi:ribosome-associated heat shock protein Hsp15